MTDSTFDLDKLERLEREATPGPWCVETITHHSDCGQHSIEEYRLYEVYEDDPPLAALGAHPDAGHDAKLIAALRNAAPALFAELRTLRARVAGAEAERDNTAAALLMIGAEVAGDPKIDAADRSDPRWTPTLAHVAEMRARVAELERDARLGQAVREAAEQTGDITDVEVLSDDDLCRGVYLGTIVITEHQFDVLRAIDSALREEEGEGGGGG